MITNPNLPNPEDVLRMSEDEVLEWLDRLYLTDPDYYHLSRGQASMFQIVLYLLLQKTKMLGRMVELSNARPIKIEIPRDWSTLSMGCKVTETHCCICGHKARSDMELCEHLRVPEKR